MITVSYKITILLNIVEGEDPSYPHDVIDPHKIWEYCLDNQKTYIDSTIQNHKDHLKLFLYIDRTVKGDDLIKTIGIEEKMFQKNIFPKDTLQDSLFEGYNVQDVSFKVLGVILNE